MACIFFGCLFIIAGLLFAMGKIHVRMEAWKNMPDEEKSKLNIRALVRNIGQMILLCGVIFLAKGIFTGFSDRWFVIAMIGWLVAAGLDVWHISKSSRYQRK